MKDKPERSWRALSILMFVLGCTSSSAPQSVGPLTLPESTSAVLVSSARFFAIDPTATLNNSAMRNCRFGRTTKIPVVSSLVELRTTALRVSGQELATLSGGRLLPAHTAALKTRLQPMATVSRSLAERACHPWRAGPDDASMTPALLVAVEASAPASSLEAIIDAAWTSGFEEVALWTRAAGSEVTVQGKGTMLAPAGESVTDVVAEIDGIRAGGDPCVLIAPQPARDTTGSAAEGEPMSAILSSNIPVLPLARTGERRLVSGELCGVPLQPGADMSGSGGEP